MAFEDGETQADTHTVGPGIRAFVAVFLATFVACGLFEVEAWPFSGWKLFSELRTDEVRSWLATGVDAGGVEQPIPFGSFGPAYRGELQVLKGFDDLSADGQQVVCRAWAGELARTGTPVVEIRIYATTRPARDPGGGGRDLRHVCRDP